MNIDMLSLSAHKFHGPKGVGAFYCRRGIPLNNLIDGGAQERGKRAGTENVAGIVGLATALRIADSELEQTAPRLTAMRDRLIDGILQSIPMCRLNGSRTNRLPGNCNISFLGLEGESLLLRLTLRALPLLPVPPAPPARLTQAMCCLPSVCRMRSHTARYGCRCPI